MAAELIEGPRVLGLGLGLFLLVVLWSSVLAIVLVCSRLSVGAGVALSSLAFAITAIMLAVPRNPPAYKDIGGGGGEDILSDELEEGDFVVYDTIVIWKIALLCYLGLTALAGAACFLCRHGKEGVYPQQLRRTNAQTGALK